MAHTSIKYKVERDERYLPYINLGRWLCSHFQLETLLNVHKPITQEMYNIVLVALQNEMDRNGPK